MTHPLVARLTDEFGWPRFEDAEAAQAWIARPGAHCLFVPGDAARNLETADVAVIVSELKLAFQGAFDCAVVGDAIEAQIRDASGILKTPSLIFYREGHCLGGIPKVRDWEDYMSHIPRILARPLTANA